VNLNPQKMKILKYSAIALAAVLTFASCDDETTTKTPVDAPDGVIEDQEDVDLVVTALEGEITGAITLAANEDWVLSGPLVVAAGGSLTIEAGTTIKATAGGTNVYIAIERDATITAVGTAAAPITITSGAAAPASGDWGGLLLMGNAKITGGLSGVTEVVDFIYGGTEDTDDSGDIAYLVLEYTGARINGEKEFNGLTLYGVGNGTSISNVMISEGDDDAIEFFGGTVNVSNILVVNAKDDMFDWTQGWNGTATNVYGVRETGFTEVTADPRGIEGDGNLDGLTPSLTPQSNPTITNVTLANYSTAVIADFIKIRRNSGATVTNALVVQGSSAVAPGDVVDLDDSAGSAASTTTVNVSILGTNLAVDNIDNTNANGAIATITFPGTQNVGAATSNFTWTGYTFPTLPVPPVPAL
jgi:hypothetical protein